MNEIGVDTRLEKRSKEWERELRSQIGQYFENNGIPCYSRYPYIINKTSDDDWHKNIILEKVWDYIEKKKAQRHENKKSFALHKYVHHGLSSQAFLFNLLGPLVVDKKWRVFDKILESADIRLGDSIAGAEFEVEDREVFNEKQGQPTSIDLCLSTRDKEAVFIEFKFTEKNFGGCSVFNDGDCDGQNPAKNFDLCYLHKHEKRLYWERMEKEGLLTEQIKNSFQCPFATLYQIYRLILFALEKGGHFLLIYDKRNPSFLVEKDNIERGLYNLVYDMLPSDAQDRCHKLSVQSIFPKIQNHLAPETTNELQIKYF